MYAEPSRTEQRQQMFKRLQIGGIGIAAIMLMIGLASVVNERLLGNAPADTVATGTVSSGGATPAGSENSEPLAELGVTPDLPATQNKTPKTPNATSRQPVVMRPGGTVPDLKNPPAGQNTPGR